MPDTTRVELWPADRTSAPLADRASASPRCGQGAPTQKHKERDEARQEMVAIFSKIIANRRSGAVKSDDFLQKIIDFRYKDETDKSGNVTKKGRGFTDSEVTGWLIVLLFAGQHTCAGRS